jgi:hypothetical protein
MCDRQKNNAHIFVQFSQIIIAVAGFPTLMFVLDVISMLNAASNTGIYAQFDCSAESHFRETS